MHLAAHLVALIAVLGTGVVYGTDAFCAFVQRPALARVDDAALTAVMGNVHRVADRRMPAPGVLGIIAADRRETPPNARALQRDWDHIILPRATLQGLAVAALGVTLIT